MRKLLTSAPSITVVGLVSAYLLVGFFLLPALVQWQLPKQLADRGHRLELGDVRFDPLRLRLEVDALALSDAAGAPMARFDHLMLDLQWRTIVDRTWTIADVRLLGPAVRFERARDGSHNFSALIAQFAGTDSDRPRQDDAGGIVPARVARVLLAGGDIAWMDQMLEQPLVTRVTPLRIESSGLSTVEGEPGHYRISARTAAGESLELHGAIGIAARHASGDLAVRGLQVATLARALNRELALQAPRGDLDAAAHFDLSLAPDGAPAGTVHGMQLALADLFLQPPGATAPLLAVQQLALDDGSVDLAQRQLQFARLQIADVSANAGIDAQGQGSWLALLRGRRTAADGGAGAQPAAGTGGGAVPAAPPTSAPASKAPPVPGSSASATTAEPAASSSPASAATSPTRPASAPATATAAASVAAEPPASVARAASAPAPATATAAASAAAASSASVAASVAAPPARVGSAPGPSTANATAAGSATAAAPAASTTADASWQLRIDEVRIDRLALALRDAAQGRSVTLAGLGLGTSLDGVFGSAGELRLRLPQLRLAIDGLALAQGDAGIDVVSTLLTTGALDVQAGGDTIDVTMGTVALELAQGLAARSGAQTASAGAGTIAASGLRVRNSAAGARVQLDAPRWQAQSLAAAAPGQEARIGAAEMSGSRLVLDAGAATMTLALDEPTLRLDAVAARGAQKPRAVVDADATTVAAAPAAAVSGVQAAPLRASPATAGDRTTSSSETSANPADPSARWDRLTLQAQRLSLAMVGGENTVGLDALQTQLQNLRLQADGQDLALASLALDNARLSVRQGAAGAQLQADTPSLRLAGIAVQRGAERADLSELQLSGSRWGMTTGSDGATELALAGVQLSGRQLALARDAEGLQLASLALGSEQLALVLGADRLRFSGSGATAAFTGLAAVQAGGDRLALQEARWQARSFDGSSALAAGPAQAQARIDGSELRLTALGVGRGGATPTPGAGTATAAPGTGTATAAPGASAATPAPGAGAAATAPARAAIARGGKDLASLASASWSAGSLSLALTDGPVQLRGEAMALQLGQAQLHDPSATDTQLVQLGDIGVSGAMFSLSDRSVLVDALRVGGVRASVWLDAQGRLNLLEVLDPAPSAAPAPATAPAAVQAAASAPTAAATATAGSGAGAGGGPAGNAGAAKPWRVAVKTIALQDAAVRFEDRRNATPLALGLDAIALSLSGLDTAAGAPPMQVDAAATLASGGRLQAKGRAALDPQMADLQLEVSGVALSVVQPLLSDYVALTLASGSASTQGRLTYGAVADVPARLSYVGGFAVDDFLLEEIAPKRPFLAWQSIRSTDLKLTLEPNAVDIGEVLLDKPVGRLIIAEDQSINITDVIRKREVQAADTPAAPAAGEKAAAEPAFPVTVARIKVSDGQLEFADLSLRPQFGTRMHQLKGVVTGLGTDANRSAQVQLDARVDKFGSARIRGQASVLQPERLTDIAMIFRNLDMATLSPYVVKFAGYEIASGRLSLDLQYKVRDGKLLGENKVVLNKAELGKKVESPGALDLPLELALAILKDSNGVIDIGVPVSGDLNDPKFDYGAVIAKAIGNLLGGIVTAPFRALAAMFGGGDKPIDTIAFEPGRSSLAPPEQQKMETISKALRERPQLVLRVAPVVAPAQDTPVLQSLVVRSEIARRMGLELAPDEDPGPIDAANPRVPAAVEAAFGARYAPAVFDALKQRAIAAAAPKGPVADGVPGDGAAAVAAAGATGGTGVAGAAGTSASSPAASAASAAAAKGAAAAPPPAPPPAFYQGLIARMIADQEISDAMLAQLGARRAEAIVQAVTGAEGAGVPAERVHVVDLRKLTDAGADVVPLKLDLEVAK